MGGKQYPNTRKWTRGLIPTILSFPPSISTPFSAHLNPAQSQYNSLLMTSKPETAPAPAPIFNGKPLGPITMAIDIGGSGLKAILLDAKGRPWPLISVSQIHSAIIHRVDRPAVRPLQGDGLITSEPGILLGIKIADCLPVLIVDPERRAIGVFHAGWRGTARRTSRIRSASSLSVSSPRSNASLPTMMR